MTGLRLMDPDALRGGVVAIFVATGAPSDLAEVVADHLIESELMGHPSHGVLRVPDYISRIEGGRLDPAARGSVARECATVVVVDGEWGFGQVAAVEATRGAIAKASKAGVSVGGAYHVNHVGRLGAFTEMAAAEGMVAFAFVGGTPTGMRGNVAPFGGREAVWGTNPLAIAVPGADRIFSLDFATSVIAGGKAAAARARGALLEEEYLIDRAGIPTADPNALLEGGSIRPFGAHKGYGLAFAVELLAGALIGASAPELMEGEMHNGLLMIMVDPGRLHPGDGFRHAVEGVIDRVKASPPAAGFDEVMYPGELERARAREAGRRGIEVPAGLIDELAAIAARLRTDPGW